MIHRILTYTLCCILLPAYVLCQQQDADAMFREHASHNFSVQSDTTKTFTQFNWQFQTNAAIRSTPVCNKELVFVGSSDGYLYALHKQDGKLAWKFNCGSAITASPAYSKGIVYVSTLDQHLFAVDVANGKQVYSKTTGDNPVYDWGFDYYGSSPVIKEDTLFIAAADGTVNALDKRNGKTFWSSKPGSFIRSTPAIADGLLYVGDVKGILFTLESKNGKVGWSYKTKGADFNNVQFGFDRNAIISSPTVADSLILFGSRDGYLYALSRFSGKLSWSYDYQISWVISTPVVVEGKVIVGTSDGQFIHALNEGTGKELWCTKTTAPVWSSALAAGNAIYMPCNDGVLYCLDLASGIMKPHPFVVDDKIFSSPVVSDSLLFFGADNGILYCLKQAPALSVKYNHFVYWDKPIQYNATRLSNSLLVKKFLNLRGYASLDADKLLQLAKKDTSQHNIVVFATEFLPSAFWNKDSSSDYLLQHFMEEGNTIVALGFNPLAIDFDDSTGFYKLFNFKRAAQILNVQYNENDLRSLNGFIPATATATGIAMGMKPQFIASCPLTSNDVDVDVVLGRDERNRIVAFVKKVGEKGGAYVQLFISRDFVEDYNFIDEVVKHWENG
jgi:outer membrane protein assembly factor BamB